MCDIERLIRDSGAIKQGQFSLSNGELTEYYVDKYVFETDPELLSKIASEIGHTLSAKEVDVVAGPSLGAVPLVTAVSLKTGIDAAYVRKGETHCGTQARIEGTIRKGQRVVIVEDVSATGQTIVETARLIEELGGVTERVVVVVDRNEGAISMVCDEGYELESLFQLPDGFEG